jgi:hypothetical protein
MKMQCQNERNWNSGNGNTDYVLEGSSFGAINAVVPNITGCGEAHNSNANVQDEDVIMPVMYVS